MSKRAHIDNRTATGASEYLSAAPLAALVIAYGLAISLYTVFVHQFTVHGTPEDAVKKAALSCADQMQTVTVDDAVFGRVGLCDSQSPQTGRVISINTLYATLRADHRIADELGLAYVNRLVDADCTRVKSIEQQLRKALARSVAGAAEPKSASMFHRAYSMLVNAQGGERLVNFNVRLGGSAPAIFTSGINADHEPSEFVQNGQYKAGVNVPITDDDWSQFYELAPNTRLCNERFFQPASGSSTPSMVLVEASFGSGDSQDVGTMRKLVACAVVGTNQVAPPPSVLMLSFPHGRPKDIRSLRTLMTAHGPHFGQWRQAEQGDVPGRGNLANATDGLAEMQDDEAMQTAFYHWLRSQGIDTSLNACRKLYDMDFGMMPIDAQPIDGPVDTTIVNSALAKDTGARSYAFAKQTNPGDSGQPALQNAFAGLSNAALFPKSALPLTIDISGNCNIAGRAGFDRALVEQFFDGLKRTNLSSIESGTIARRIIDRMVQATQETERALSITREELNSVTANVRGASRDPNSASVKQLTRLKHSERDLVIAVDNLHNKLQEYKLIKQRAQNIAVNADYTAKVSFDLCANMSELAREGLYATQSPDGFLVRKDTVFAPKLSPVTESDIYSPKKYPDENSWESANFNVLKHTTADTKVDGIPMSRIGQLKSVQPATPRFIVFSSRQLADGTSLPVVVARSPYGSSGVAEGQLAFYAPDAIRSGTAPQIGWSVLLRDLAAFGLGDRKGFAPSTLRWCQNDQLPNGRCPDLAAEIQVRAPVPIIPDLPVGASLKNPVTNESVSEIPPMPVGML